MPRQPGLILQDVGSIEEAVRAVLDEKCEHGLPDLHPFFTLPQLHLNPRAGRDPSSSLVSHA
jgi:hypothetical protein